MTQSPGEVGSIIGTIQTDTFCEGCGYNLHTQAVARDDRLGILIVRCPECGRYAAVGQTTTAARAWLNRLATLLLTGWIGFLLLLFALCSLFMGLLSYGHMESMTDYKQVSGPVPGTMPAAGYIGTYKFQYEIKQIPPEDVDQRASQRSEQIWLTSLTVSLSLLAGILFSTLLWHCKDWAGLLSFLPAIAGCGIAAMIWASDPQTLLVRGWGVRQIGVFFLIDLIAIAVILGRRFARGLLRLLVAPKARQHLAFLWIVDGKTLKLD
jgi:hypothetical protein